ncbi:MAG: hypothetical protein MZV65_46155 [Chromatiales bacterium]|nr:hypothetical protein [Chromatiales bacterium]
MSVGRTGLGAGVPELAAALASHATGQGDICVEPAPVGVALERSRRPGLPRLRHRPSASGWRRCTPVLWWAGRANASRWCSTGGAGCICTAIGEYEQQLADDLLQRAGARVGGGR